MARHAFVTGGTGFIGINLIEELLSRGWQITALHRESSDLTYLRELDVSLAKGDITRAETLDAAIPDDADAIFHLAGDTNLWARHNDRQYSINVLGTRNMVNAAARKGIKTFIHTSSIAAWGDSISGTVTEETPQKGQHSWINYEYTKWAGEREALKGLDHGMKVVVLNPAHVSGPYDRNNWGRLFYALRDGDLPGIPDGTVWIAHGREVARAHANALEEGKSGERYILAGPEHPFSEFVRTIASVSGIDDLPKKIPTPLLKIIARLQTFTAAFTNNPPAVTPELATLMTRDGASFSSEKAKRELHYQTVPMEQVVRDCYQWLTEEADL